MPIKIDGHHDNLVWRALRRAMIEDIETSTRDLAERYCDERDANFLRGRIASLRDLIDQVEGSNPNLASHNPPGRGVADRNF